jgi:hypothetical protein
MRFAGSAGDDSAFLFIALTAVGPEVHRFAAAGFGSPA